MNRLTEEKAKEYALEYFNKMPELQLIWNTIHSEGIIEILEVIAQGKCIDIDRLSAIAWIHDIGKTIANNNHAELSLGIIEKDFLLDDIDRDCILNHGTSGNPKTEEGKFFRYADGLSVFTSDLIHFQFFALGKEGLSFHEIKDNMEGIYKKYKSCYVDSPEIIKLLDESYKKNFR